MARPNRPTWHKHSGRFRCVIEGKPTYFPKSIGRLDKPLRDGIPLRAWEHLDELLRRAHERATSHADPTVAWLAERFLQWCEAERDAGRIVPGQYRYHLTHLDLFLEAPGLGGVRAKDLTVDRLDDFFDRLRGQVLPRTGRPPSAHYVHNVGKTVRTMYRWAARPVKGREPARLVHPNPLDGYKFPGQPGAVRGYVEGEVIRRFLRWAWARARSHPAGSLKRRFERMYVLMIRFERLTGCRPGEACGLEWAEVTPAPPGRPGGEAGPAWEPKVIDVRPEKVKTRRQTTRARRIHVTPPVARLLRALERLEGRHPEYVFTHMRGKGAEARGELDPVAGEPWPSGSAASKKLAQLRDAAIASGVEGIERVGPKKLVAYANRHSLASEASSLGFSDEQIAEQLGNTPEVLRRVYAHTVDEAAAERAAQIAQGRRRVVGRDAKPGRSGRPPGPAPGDPGGDPTA